jgi:hypothetical protein
MFKAMFADEKFSPKDKISTAKELLRNSTFIYSDPTGETQKVRIIISMAKVTDVWAC